MAPISSNQKKAVYLSVASLGGLACIFGVAGSFAGVKSSASSCTSGAAAALGILGSLIMLAAQITSNANGGCVCYCTRKGSSISSAGAKVGAIICLILSWKLTLSATMTLLVGGFVNLKPDEENGGCSSAGRSALLMGGILSLLATGLSLIFYAIVTNYSSTDDKIAHTGEYPPRPDGNIAAAAPVASPAGVGYK